MRVNGIRCDMCCKEHLFEPSFQFPHLSIREVLPDSWFMLLQGGKLDLSQEPLLFCGVDCLSQWAGKQVAIDREAKQGPEYKEVLKAMAEAENAWEKW